MVVQTELYAEIRQLQFFVGCALGVPAKRTDFRGMHLLSYALAYFDDLAWFLEQPTLVVGSSGRPGGEPGFVEVRLPRAEDLDAHGMWQLEAIAYVIVLPRVKTPHMTAYKVEQMSR
jgi:hypothetical protein